MLEQFGAIAILAGVAFVFPFIPLIIAAVISVHKPSKEKELCYECGVDTIGRSWVQFKSSYFLYALAFVAFDVETVFLYPWAVVVKEFGAKALLSIGFFLVVLVLGLAYAWRKGDLEWK